MLSRAYFLISCSLFDISYFFLNLLLKDPLNEEIQLSIKRIIGKLSEMSFSV
jgi:hypothetical protein